MEQIVNMRDLGGLTTKSGLQIKQKMLFRAGNPAKASKADCEKLEQYNLQQIIDFRCANEKHEREQSFAQQFNWVSQPIAVGNVVNLFDKNLTKKTAYQAMCHLYRRLPIEFQCQYKYFLAQAEQGQVMLYHCTAGKDRTGFGSLLLLSALGVDLDTIMADYLLSNNAIDALKQQMSDMWTDEAINPEVLDVLLEVHEEYLENAIDVINKEFGNIEKYLKYTLAIDRALICQHYLE